MSVPSNFPRPFDTSLGSNFTNSSCPNYFSTFLSNQSFIQCYPMSFYLLNSQSYVEYIRQGRLNAINQILNVTCNQIPSFQQCVQVMNDLSDELINHCNQDYKLQNPLVVQAHNDFISYSMVYQTTCLQQATNSNTSYCYSNDLYGSYLNTSDIYLYLLPLGINFPNLTLLNVTCTQCTQDIMNIFYSSTGNLSQPVSYTYNSGAQVIVDMCGSSFINSSAKPLPATTASTTGKKSLAVHLNTNITLLLTLLLASLLFI
jgi:hypothetical protein